MNHKHVGIIVVRLSISPEQVRNTMELLAEGGTVPFISRYRKEATGSLDEVQIGNILLEMTKLKELDERRVYILGSIEKQGKLTDALQAGIDAATTLVELEDLYLPYKPKRKTRAQAAREKGLEPLAAMIFMQEPGTDLQTEAGKYVVDLIYNVEEALEGARDIMAEWVSEDIDARNAIRRIFEREALLRAVVVEGMEEQGAKFRDYFNFFELLYKCPSHRILAIFRGEAEGYLRFIIEPPQDKCTDTLKRLFLRRGGEPSCCEQVMMSIEDGYSRLMSPSIETEFASSAKERADEEAIRVFADNTRQLLMSPPLGQKQVLALDPGFRSGVKVVILDAQGNFIINDTIYPHPPQEDTALAAVKLRGLVDKYDIEAISIGNGTASRETEAFVRGLKFGKDIPIYVVNESGASIYSASEAAREEFPNQDVTVRGSISIGRRLMDPLAELVKIDPKSIGVGQYQHDVDQTKLKHSLDMVVESCVNAVGVNVNTASKHLLMYVSGLGPVLAQNIVDYRAENGAFKSRSELKKVTRLGAKAFEQCAGFLRIHGATNPLDNSAVHPESYHIVAAMATDLNAKVGDLLTDDSRRGKIDLRKYVNETVGLPTLNDILAELAKPGRDPREQLTVFAFAKGVHTLADLKEGMSLPGIVTNVTAFGAFVDIGVHQDGLVHISEMADRFIKDPSEVVKLQQHVQVRVMTIDKERKRIQLSMKE